MVPTWLQNGGQNGAQNRSKSIKDRVWKQGPKKITKKCETWVPRTLNYWALVREGFNFHWLQMSEPSTKNGAKIGAKLVPKSMKMGVRKPLGNWSKKHVQKVWTMEPKGVPIGSQNGAKCVPEGGKEDANNWFYEKIPLGSLLGPSWAPFWLNFVSNFDHCLNIC